MTVPTMKEIAAEMFSIITQRWINEASTHTLKEALSLSRKLLDVLECDRQPTYLKLAVKELNETLQKIHAPKETETGKEIPLNDEPNEGLCLRTGVNNGIVPVDNQAVSPSVPESVEVIKRRRTRSDKGIKRGPKATEKTVEATREVGDVF